MKKSRFTEPQVMGILRQAEGEITMSQAAHKSHSQTTPCP